MEVRVINGDGGHRIDSWKSKSKSESEKLKSGREEGTRKGL